MTIQQLIAILQTAENKDIEVVIRTQNNGANIVCGTGYWSANIANASLDTCDVILPDSNSGEHQVLIIS